jgi:hypothetical protein
MPSEPDFYRVDSTALLPLLEVKEFVQGTGVASAVGNGGEFCIGGCGRVAPKMDGVPGWVLEIRRAGAFDQLLPNLF